MTEHFSQKIRKQLDSALHKRGLLFIILSPFLLICSMIWAYIAYLLRRKGYKKIDDLNLPKYFSVVCIGNLLVGGTGKSPIVRAYARRHLEQNVCVAIASRGIGANPIVINSLLSTTEEVMSLSDENREHFEFLKMEFPKQQFFIYQNKNRFQSLQNFIEFRGKNLNKNHLFLLDDGLQHFDCPRHVNICVCDSILDVSAPHFSIPFGPYREGFGHKSIEKILSSFDMCLWPSAKRYNALDVEDRNYAYFHHKNLTVSYELKFIKIIIQNTDEFILEKIDKRDFINKNFENTILITGIAHPDRFFKSLLLLNATLSNCERIYLPDHGKLAVTAVQKISAKDILILTMKDFFRFSNDKSFLTSLADTTTYGCYLEYDIPLIDAKTEI